MTKKDEIMDSTYELIIEKGLYNVSTNDIAIKANTSPGTIFYHFDSKDSLIEEVLIEYILNMYTTQLNAIESFEGNTYSCLKQFCHKILELEKQEKSNQDEVKNGLLCFFEGKKDYVNVNSAFDEYDKYFMSVLRKIIETGKNNGEIRLDLDTEKIAVVIKSHLYGTFFLWMVNNIDNVEEHVELSFNYLWDYMKK